MRTCKYLSFIIAFAILAAGNNFIAMSNTSEEEMQPTAKKPVAKKAAKKKTAEKTSKAKPTEDEKPANKKPSLKSTPNQLTDEELQEKIYSAVRDALEEKAKNKQAEKERLAKEKQAEEERIAKEEAVAKTLNIDPTTLRLLLSSDWWNSNRDVFGDNGKNNWLPIVNTGSVPEVYPGMFRYAMNFGLPNGLYSLPSVGDPSAVVRNLISNITNNTTIMSERYKSYHTYRGGCLIGDKQVVFWNIAKINEVFNKTHAKSLYVGVLGYDIQGNPLVEIKLEGIDLHGAMLFIVQEKHINANGGVTFYLYKDGQIITLGKMSVQHCM